MIGKTRNEQRILMGKPLGKYPIVKYEEGGSDNTNMNLRMDIRIEGWTELAQDPV